MPGGATWGPMPRNLRLHRRGGGPAARPAGASTGRRPTADVAALVAGVERGLLVTDLWYTRVLDPRTLVVTGLTRNGVWLIEDGEIDPGGAQPPVHPVVPAGARAGRGARRRARGAVRQPDRVDGAWWAAPALRLASWNFTGGASG